MVDVKVSAIDGSYHEVDSNEMAFKVAASQTAKAALRKAAESTDHTGVTQLKRANLA